MVVVRAVDPLAAGRDCGVQSVFACCMTMGRGDITLAEMTRRSPSNESGVSIGDLVALLKSCDVTASPVRVGFSQLLNLNTPAILHVNRSHFIALLGFASGQAIIFDNSVGILRCNAEWFHQKYQWEGVAIVCGELPTQLEMILNDPATGWACLALAAFTILVPTRRAAIRVDHRLQSLW